MYCSECKKKMEKGYVYLGHTDLEWYPESEIINWKKESIIGSVLMFDIFRKERIIKNHRGVRISCKKNGSNEMNFKLVAHLCRKCCKCVIEYNKAEDE